MGVVEVFNNKQTTEFTGVIGIEVIDVNEKVRDYHLNWITGVHETAWSGSLEFNFKLFTHNID